MEKSKNVFGETKNLLGAELPLTSMVHWSRATIKIEFASAFTHSFHAVFLNFQLFLDVIKPSLTTILQEITGMFMLKLR